MHAICTVFSYIYPEHDLVITDLNSCQSICMFQSIKKGSIKIYLKKVQKSRACIPLIGVY